jgi:hypothetical protein
VVAEHGRRHPGIHGPNRHRQPYALTDIDERIRNILSRGA